MSDDKGKHYRHSYRGVKLDPYRVCQVYGIGGGPREHIVKKALRGASKGHTELDVIAELRACLDRWEEMVLEDQPGPGVRPIPLAPRWHTEEDI